MDDMAGIRDTLYLASSALQTHSTEIHIAAHNIANISTDGFVPLKVANATGPKGRGVKVDAITRNGMPLGRHSTRVQEKDKDVFQASGSAIPDASGTDLATEMVSMISSRHSFDADAKLIHATDEMLDTLLNLKA